MASWLDERRTTREGRDYQCDGSGNVEIFYAEYSGCGRSLEASLELSEAELVEMLERLRAHNEEYNRDR